jgi:hypothetical protein
VLRQQQGFQWLEPTLFVYGLHDGFHAGKLTGCPPSTSGSFKTPWVQILWRPSLPPDRPGTVRFFAKNRS